MDGSYSAGAVAKGFWFSEFKQVVREYRESSDPKKIREKQTQENFLSAKSLDYGRKMVGTSLTKIEALPKELMNIFFELDTQNQKLLNLIGIILTDQLFMEFVNETFRKSLLVGEYDVRSSINKIFIENKKIESKQFNNFSDATQRRLISSYSNYLKEANLVRTTSNHEVYVPALLDDKIKDVLVENNLGFLIGLLGDKI